MLSPVCAPVTPEGVTVRRPVALRLIKGEYVTAAPLLLTVGTLSACAVNVVWVLSATVTLMVSWTSSPQTTYCGGGQLVQV